MKLEDALVNNDGVASIHAALVTHHDISGTAEEIGDLSSTFVTLLSSDDDNVGQGHCGPKPRICTIRDYLRFGSFLSKTV